jgi:hypothetical protein
MVRIASRIRSHPQASAILFPVNSDGVFHLAREFFSMTRLLAGAVAFGTVALLVLSIVTALVSLTLSGAVGLAPPHGDEGETGMAN